MFKAVVKGKGYFGDFDGRVKKMKEIATHLQEDANPYLHQIIRDIKDGLYPNRNAQYPKDNMLY